MLATRLSVVPNVPKLLHVDGKVAANASIGGRFCPPYRHRNPHASKSEIRRLRIATSPQSELRVICRQHATSSCSQLFKEYRAESSVHRRGCQSSAPEL